MPPLVKLPVAPANLTAQRRATTVDLLFIVPAANTDGTRPANVERVDVYAITGPRTLTDDQIVKLGTKVASVQVKAPRDPDATTEPDNPDEEVDPPEGKGLNQGVVALVTEQLTDQAIVPVTPPEDKKSSRTPRRRRGRCWRRHGVAVADVRRRRHHDARTQGTVLDARLRVVGAAAGAAASADGQL